MLRGLLDQHVRVALRGRDYPTHHAVGAQMANQSAGVDLGQHRNGISLHVLVGDLFGTPIRADRRELADNQPLDIGPGRLVIRLIGAVIADLGVGENDNLPGIGWIGRYFLVSGKRSIKNDFALAFAWVPIAEATEDAPVFERQYRLHRLSGEWIQPILAGFTVGSLARSRVFQCTTPASLAGQ